MYTVFTYKTSLLLNISQKYRESDIERISLDKHLDQGPGLQYRGMKMNYWGLQWTKG